MNSANKGKDMTIMTDVQKDLVGSLWELYWEQYVIDHPDADGADYNEEIEAFFNDFED